MSDQKDKKPKPALQKPKDINQTLQSLKHDLEERVKELSCLYEISKIIEKHRYSLDKILLDIVNLIPKAWRYPEITCVQVSLKDKQITTQNFKQTAWKQTSDIVVKNEKMGFLEVGYLLKRPESYEGPFLLEERRLIDAIAERIGSTIERIEGDTLLKQSEQRYRSIFHNAAEGIIIADFRTREFKYVNEAICDLLGYSQKELEQMRVDDIHPKESLEHILSIFKSMSKKEIEHEKSIPCLRKDGAVIYADINASKIVIDQKDYLAGFFNDVNERENLISRNQKILEASIDGFSVTGPDGTLLEVNPALCNISGYSKKELVGMKISDIDTHMTPEQIAQIIDKVMKQGHDRFETKHRHKDGKIIDVEVRTQHCNLDGKELFFNFTRDITDTKLSTDNLKKSEKRYKTLCTNIPGMVYRGRPDWSTEVISGSEGICGYCPEDINSKSVKWLDVIHPDDQKKVADEALRLNEKASTLVQEYRIIAKDGSIRWAEDHKTSVFTKEGLFDGVAGVLFDTTEHRQAEQMLRESEDKYRTLLENIDQVICRIDENGTFLFMNDYAANQLGGRASDHIGKTMYDLFPKETADRQMESIRKAIKSNKSLIVEESQSVVKGMNRWYESRIWPHGKRTVLLVANDITEIKQNEAELESYREKISQDQRHAYVNSMAAIVAHQVNQPLTKINILLDRAIEQMEEASSCPTVLKNVKEGLAESQKAADMIRKFRQHSTGPATEDAGKINVISVADRISSVLSEKARQAKMLISTQDSGDLPEVITNEVALEQIFFIIIQNAIDAADDGEPHKLDITGKFVDGNVELQFSDDCCGIAAENLERIFEPFFSTKSKDRGMGLGLDIVQQILISFGGQIRAESQPGKGATFYVTLPVSNSKGYKR